MKTSLIALLLLVGCGSKDAGPKAAPWATGKLKTETHELAGVKYSIDMPETTLMVPTSKKHTYEYVTRNRKQKMPKFWIRVASYKRPFDEWKASQEQIYKGIQFEHVEKNGDGFSATSLQPPKDKDDITQRTHERVLPHGEGHISCYATSYFGSSETEMARIREICASLKVL